MNESILPGATLNARARPKPRQITAPLLALICLTGFMVSLTINYPGFMTYDSVVQILEARAGIYSDWHPPFMAFLWHFLNQIIPGPFGMLILQTGLIWCGTFLIAVFFFNNTRYPLLALTPCLLVFYPPIFGISGAIWKDILMWGFLVLAIGIAGAIKPFSPATAYRGIAKLTAGSVVLLAAILCRHNSIFAVFPIFALGVVRSIPAASSARYRVTATLFAAVLFAVLLFATSLINNALTTYKTPTWKLVALFDIAGTIHAMTDPEQQRRTYERVPANLRGNGTLENLLLTYSPTDCATLMQETNPAFVDHPSVDLTEQQRTDLLHLWSETALRHPLAFLIHKINVFRELLGLSESKLRSPVVMVSDYPDSLAQKYGPNVQKLNSFQNAVYRLLIHISWHFPFRVWIYFVINILVIVTCLVFRTPERLQIALIAGSGFAHEAGLFLGVPTTDFRYSHYMIYASLLAFLLLIQNVLQARDAACLRRVV